MKILIIIIVLSLIVWVAYGFFSSRVKEPKYAVLSKKSGYEIRQYAPHIEARVIVSGTYREAVGRGFSILAGYIFGGNTKKRSIAMTAPVSEQKSESIAMTAPVLETVVGDTDRVVSFVMPDEYTLDTLPTPNDPSIEIVFVPSHTSAVMRYSGYATEDTVVQMKEKLLQSLMRDNVVAIGVPRSARYNPPWTPGIMMRNEVLVDVNFQD